MCGRDLARIAVGAGCMAGLGVLTIFAFDGFYVVTLVPMFFLGAIVLGLVAVLGVIPRRNRVILADDPRRACLEAMDRKMAARSLLLFAVLAGMCLSSVALLIWVNVRENGWGFVFGMIAVLFTFTWLEVCVLEPRRLRRERDALLSVPPPPPAVEGLSD